MRLHFLVEGVGEEAFLNAWLPRFLPAAHSYKIYPHEGKGRLAADFHRKPDPAQRGLLDQLPAKLRAFGNHLDSETDRVVILIDLDDQDCHDLKKRLEKAVKSCDPQPAVLIRIAIEETESFFLSDPKAIKSAFPSAKVGKLRSYKPDSICGAWEKMREVIDDSSTSEDKVGWAEAIGPHLGIDWKGRNANKSPSFRVFCRGLLRICGEALD
jgi:hypothetical protein